MQFIFTIKNTHAAKIDHSKPNSVFVSLKVKVKTLRLRSYGVAPGKYNEVHNSFFVTGKQIIIMFIVS